MLGIDGVEVRTVLIHELHVDTILVDILIDTLNTLVKTTHFSKTSVIDLSWRIRGE